MAYYTSRNKELFLNIIRLRYGHPPAVLTVGNISGSTTISGSFGLTGSLQWVTPPFSRTSSIAPNPSVSYSDNPIISYTPMDDGAYHTRFLTNLSLKQMFTLLNSSWSIARIFRVMLQRAGTALNASSATRSTSSHPPTYEKFDEMVYILRRLQVDDAFIILYHETKDGIDLTLQLNERAKLTAKEKRTLKQAGVDVFDNKIVFSDYIAPHQTLVITRSVLGVLNYLSKGTMVPPIEAETGAMPLTYDKGKVYDWQKVLRGIMKIEYSTRQPDNTFVSVPYHGFWYYIDERDNNSKETFVLLINIIGLLAGPTPGPTIGLTRVA